MKQKFPFSGKVRYGKRNKSYEAEYNLARESLEKSNQTVIAQNKIISSTESIIADLKTKIYQQQEIIKKQKNLLNGNKNN